MRIKGYFASAYRGALGDSASEEDIRYNVEKAIEVGCKIRSDFPNSLSLFIPHEECICNKLWQAGMINSDQILEACCSIVEDMDFLISYGIVSDGMACEIDQAEALNIPVIYIDSYGENEKYQIAELIASLREMSEPSEDKDE